MSKSQQESIRRAGAATDLQRALRALRQVRIALDDCNLIDAKEAADELAIALEAVEAKVGVRTPASLFE